MYSSKTNPSDIIFEGLAIFVSVFDLGDETFRYSLRGLERGGNFLLSPASA